MPPATAHLDGLNPAQRRAVTYGEAVEGQPFRSGPLLIVAGAGTGKTSTLAARVAHLVLNGVDPGRILMLTFTRRAALEMRRRARDYVKAAINDTLGGASQALAQRLQWAGTFHSIGSRLLRHYAAQVGLDPGFTVLDRGDSADLVDSIREQLGFATRERRFPRKDTCLAIYSHRVNSRRSLVETLEAQFPWCREWSDELTQLFRAYVERKTQLALLDYDDLLLFWHAMMQEPRLAQHIGGHFDHVLVDEYQDTNMLQAEILLALKPHGSGVTVVGDDAQAIYSFRAAAVENILAFPDKYSPRAEVVTLAQNYRSTQGVLDPANALMAEAPRQHRKHLISSRGQGARAKLVTVDDLPSQAEYVCTQVLRRREAGVPLRRQAVLFRTGSHSDLLEVELARRKIPFVKYGGLRFLEAAHVKDVLAVLRWADNPRNDLAAFRVLQLMPGMGPVNARNALTHFEAADRAVASLAEFVPPAEAKQPWKRFTDLMAELGNAERAWPGQVRLVREWYKPHFERLYEHVHTRVGDLDQLEALSTQYPTRDRFLTELTLDPPQATSDLAGQPLLDEDYLVLSTVHSAKGMEWSCVTILNVVDGSFPNEFATRDPALIDEERRLLYVAMTRAKDELALVAPLRFNVTSAGPKSDAHVYGGRSRFLTNKVISTLEPATFHGANALAAGLGDSPKDVVDVTQRVRAMW
jgi:DNA helicase-2/ATP-dependent DNA helicase PcrA